VKLKFFLRDHLLVNIQTAQFLSIPIYLHAGLAADGQLINQHSNVRTHKYTYTAQLLGQGRRSRK